MFNKTRNQLLENLGIALPTEVSSGLRALNVQTYVESNVKLGVQYSASTYYTGLNAGEFIDIIIITGNKPVAIKAQYIAIKDGGDVIAQFYKNPTYTGGADISSGIYNQSDINPVATTIQLIGPTPTDAANFNYAINAASKPIVTNTGTPILTPVVTMGISGPGQSSQSRSDIAGLEHNLAPNTTYLFRRRVSESTASFFGFSTWYEGELDLPLV